MINNKDSNGNKLSAEQIEFFKNSKIVDENNNLMVVFHGSPLDTITSFDKNKIGARCGKSNLQFGSGFYFTRYEGSAGFYGNTFAFYLNIHNPYVVDTGGFKEYQDEFILNFKQHMVKDFNLLEYKNKEEGLVGDEIQNILTKNGYDGIIYGPEYIVAFEPNQIKSITNKKPTEHNNVNEALVEMTIRNLFNNDM
jgi:hypothetical protein